MEEFLKEIGIIQKGKIENDSYIIDIKDYNQYVDFYSLLNKSHLVDELETNSHISLEDTNINYISDRYLINLNADLNNDIYRLTCTEV